ncbi:erythromycin esterase family protein [Halobacterium yunchengense]|uniref:erythromycin esterase family protein n=1 Tax=Halobacterium yunchengense TaxID=3108497 RepID=UPI0030097A41
MIRIDTAPELVDRLRAISTEFESTDPTVDGAPLPAFDDAVADAAVVGLGEATHRTREFVQCKRRLLRRLVAEHGCRALALEAPYAETVALDDYVRRGDGDLAAVLAALGLSMYAVESFAALVRWLRAFNDGRPPEDRVAVYGVDVQSAAGAAAALRDHVADTGVAPEGLCEALDAAADGVFEGADVDADCLQTAERAADRLTARFADCDAAAPAARRHLWTLRRACEFARLAAEDRPTQWGFRDECMAAQVAWISDHAGGPVAVWAHDNHVKRGRMTGPGHPARTMGDRLGERYGDAYYALGGQFSRGAVRAYAPTDGDDADVETADGAYAMTELWVPEPPGTSVPGLFDGLDAPAAVADYRSLADGSPLADWLAPERRHRFVAGVVDPDEDRPFSRQYGALDAFDGAYFVRDATPTEPR